MFALRVRSRGTTPAMHELSSRPSSIEMQPVPAVSASGGSVRNETATAERERADAGAAMADALTEPPTPTHTLPTAFYQYASPSVAIPAGLRQTLALPTDALGITPSTLEHALSRPCLLVFSSFRSAPFSVSASAVASTPISCAAVGSLSRSPSSIVAALSASALQDGDGAEPMLPVSTDGAEITSPPLSTVIDDIRASPPLSLPGIGRMPALCVVATLSFSQRTCASATPLPDSSHADADRSAASNPSASLMAVCSSSVRTALPSPGSPARPQGGHVLVEPDAVDRDENLSISVAGSAVGGRMSGAATVSNALPSGELTGVVQQLLLGTPEGILQIADVFGLDGDSEVRCLRFRTKLSASIEATPWRILRFEEAALRQPIQCMMAILPALTWRPQTRSGRRTSSLRGVHVRAQRHDCLAMPPPLRML